MNLREGIRLNKFISESGLCSRREADKYIQNGNVFINGRKAMIGDQVMPGDKVKVNGHELEPRTGEDLIFIALNKPPGITSTTEEGVKDNIVDYVNHSKRIFPIGRLDKDSQGLIFLTNNGDLVNKILRAGNKHEKEYVVTVDKPLSDDVLKKMSEGVPMLGVMTRKCKIRKLGTYSFNITLIQGLNRQIRRMCEHFGYEVTKLERTRIMNIGLKGLPQGDWRDLNETELTELLKLTEHSSSETHKKTVTKTVKPPEKRNTSGAGPRKGNPDNRNKTGSNKRQAPKGKNNKGRNRNSGRKSR